VLRDAVEATDKAFFKDKTHPRPGPLHSVLSMARNTQLPLEETIKRFFPQHDAIIDRRTALREKYAEAKRAANVARLRRPAGVLAGAAPTSRRRRPSTSRTASATSSSTNTRTPTRCSRRSST
jgi:hypothetical protein